MLDLAVQHIKGLQTQVQVCKTTLPFPPLSLSPTLFIPMPIHKLSIKCFQYMKSLYKLYIYNHGVL